ncbi:unnamed protein product, partial [Prorocentrum cordatum]
AGSRRPPRRARAPGGRGGGGQPVAVRRGISDAACPPALLALLLDPDPMVRE